MRSTYTCPNCGKQHARLTVVECADRQMSERVLQSRIMARAKRQGWDVAHAGKARVGLPGGKAIWRTLMAEGWPDLTLAKAGHRLLFMELKKELGTVEEEQYRWLRLLNDTGNAAMVIRPHNLRDGSVAEILRNGAPLPSPPPATSPAGILQAVDRWMMQTPQPVDE